MSRTEPAPPTRVDLAFVARATLIVIGLWALASGLWLGRDILFVTLFALLVGLFLSLFVGPLVKLGVPRQVAAPPAWRSRCAPA
ncbi:MAG: hypothetical protein WEB88_07390 [Gemmatimonadota bacterium]